MPPSFSPSFAFSFLLLYPLLLPLVFQWSVSTDPCPSSPAHTNAKCSPSDLNHEHPRQFPLPSIHRHQPLPVFHAKPPPQPPVPSIPRGISTATIHAQFSLSGINCNRSKMCTAASHPPESECSVTGTHKECQRMLNERSDRISKYISVRIESQMETYVLTCPDMPWWKFMYCIKACNKWLHKYSSLYCFPCLKSHYLPAFLRSRTSVV